MRFLWWGIIFLSTLLNSMDQSNVMHCYNGYVKDKSFRFCLYAIPDLEGEPAHIDCIILWHGATEYEPLEIEKISPKPYTITTRIGTFVLDQEKIFENNKSSFTSLGSKTAVSFKCLHTQMVLKGDK